jgi:glycosyltransferase involved in cell wall biosynthesis
MRILLLPRYSVRGASSRYRLWQYVPLFERAGHEVEVQPLLEDGYLRELYCAGRRGWRWLARGYSIRLAGSLARKQFDAVICEQETLPFLPTLLELFCVRGKGKFFLDYDDAAYIKYSHWPVLRNKIPQLMTAAEAVVVGNAHLGEYARPFARRLHVIPTVVDLSKYPSQRRAGSENGIRVVWIGTPTTARLLRPLMPVMEKLQREHSTLSYRFIGAGDSFLSNGLRAEVPDWSERTETEQLSECDIGIMPLADTEFMRGKCGLKLIQYMACGLPVVASPVGINCELVEEGKNGFLAGSEQDWFEKLNGLVSCSELRASLGAAGRAKVAAGYTLDQGFAKWQEVLLGAEG